MNDATAPMMARGSALAEDFPRYFADRCLHFPAYVAAVDRELAALLYRRGEPERRVPPVCPAV